MEGKEVPKDYEKLAADAFKERDYQQALEYYRKALLKKPGDPELTNQKIKCEYIVKRQGNVFQKVIQKIQENKVEGQEPATVTPTSEPVTPASNVVKPKKEEKKKVATKEPLKKAESKESPKKASKASKKSKKK